MGGHAAPWCWGSCAGFRERTRRGGLRVGVAEEVGDGEDGREDVGKVPVATLTSAVKRVHRCWALTVARVPRRRRVRCPSRRVQ